MHGSNPIQRWPLPLFTGLAAVWLLLTMGCQRATPPVALPDPGTTHHVQVMIQTNRITVGDPLRVRVVATHPVNATVELPDLADVDTLVVRDRRTWRQPLDEERAQLVHDYTLTAFRRGDHPLGTGTVRFVEAEQELVEQEFPSYRLTVVSVRESEADTAVAPPRDLWDWPGRVPRWVWVLGSIALIAGLLGVLAAGLMTRPRRPPPAPPPPLPHETALAALRRLREQRYIERGEVDRYFTELSVIVRRYIEGRFGLRAPELTTEEFIREATTTHVLDEAQQTLVTDFLTQSDLVKFARFRPDATTMYAAYEAAERLIAETRSRPLTTEPQEVAS